MSAPQGRGAALTEERGFRDEGRRRPKSAPEASGRYSMSVVPEASGRYSMSVVPEASGRYSMSVVPQARRLGTVPQARRLGTVPQVRIGTEHRSRTSFVLLLLGLLGVCLGCLLVVNTTLAANSIQISKLQQANQADAQQVQELRQQVAAAGSAAVIAQEARRLHMRSDGQLRIVDLRTGEIIVPGAVGRVSRLAGAAPAVAVHGARVGALGAPGPRLVGRGRR